MIIARLSQKKSAPPQQCHLITIPMNNNGRASPVLAPMNKISNATLKDVTRFINIYIYINESSKVAPPEKEKNNRAALL